jgi:hypothetical protein
MNLDKVVNHGHRLPLVVDFDSSAQAEAVQADVCCLEIADGSTILNCWL